MAEEIEVDEFGIPIKKQATVEADEFGIPLKKKEVTPASPAQPTSESATVSGQQSESGAEDSKPINLPDSYQSDRSNYKDLIDGGKYNLLRGGKKITGTWDAVRKEFIKSPLLDLSPQPTTSKGAIQTMVETAIPSVAAASSLESEEDVLSRTSIEVDKIKSQAAKSIGDVEYYSQFKPLQTLIELKDAAKTVDDDATRSKIEAEIQKLSQKKLSNDDFYGAIITDKEEKSYSGYMPSIRKDQQFVPISGAVKNLPKTDMTVGELYNEYKDNVEFIAQAQNEVGQWDNLVRQKLISRLPEDKRAEVEAMPPSPETDEIISDILVNEGTIEDLLPAIGYGLNHKLDALYKLGGNIGLSDNELISKKLTEIRKDELFGKRPDGFKAEIGQSVGGMLPDIAAGVAAPEAMLLSMMSTMPNDYLGQSIYEDYMSGKDIDVSKAKKYAATSTIAQGGLMMATGKLGGGHVLLTGKKPLARAGQLLYEVAKRGTKDAFTFGLMGGYMQNKINELYDMNKDDQYLNSMLHMFVIGGLFAAKEGLGQVGKVKLPKKTQNEVDYLASFLPSNYTKEQIKALIKAGKITEQEGEEKQRKLDDFRTITNELPVEVTYSVMDKIYPLWQEKQSIIKAMNGSTDEFKSVFKGQIKDLDRKILIEAAVPLTSEELTQLGKLKKQAVGEGGADMAELKYLEARKDAAKVAEERVREEKASEEKAKEEAIKRQQEEKADIEKRRQEELNQQTDAGYSTIALDYLFTGGRDVIQSTDYLLQALVGGFTSAAKEINNIRNKYADKLGNIKDDINSDIYNQMMSEIRDVINKNYNNSKATEIFDKILKNATGFVSREGNQVSSELDKLNEQNEFQINAKYDAELEANKKFSELMPEVGGEKEVEAEIQQEKAEPKVEEKVETPQEEKVEEPQKGIKELEVSEIIPEKVQETEPTIFDKIEEAKRSKKSAKEKQSAARESVVETPTENVKETQNVADVEEEPQVSGMKTESKQISIDESKISELEKVAKANNDAKARKKAIVGINDELKKQTRKLEGTVVSSNAGRVEVYHPEMGAIDFYTNNKTGEFDSDGDPILKYKRGDKISIDRWEEARLKENYSPIQGKPSYMKRFASGEILKDAKYGISKDQLVASKIQSATPAVAPPAETVSETVVEQPTVEQPTEVATETVEEIQPETKATAEPSKGVKNFEAALNERTEKKRDKALKNFGDKEADARKLIEGYDTNIEKLKAQGIEPTGTKAEVLADMLSGKYDEQLAKPSAAKEPTQATEQPTEKETMFGKTVTFEHAGSEKSGVVKSVDAKGNLEVEGVGANKGVKYTVKKSAVISEMQEDVAVAKQEAQKENEELGKKINTVIQKAIKKQPTDAKKVIKNMVGFQQIADLPNRLFQNYVANKVRKYEDALAKALQKGSVSQNAAWRNIADFISSYSRGAMDTMEYSEAKRQKLTGGINKAKQDAEDLHGQMWDLIGGDVDSADRVHQVLDPDLRQTGLKYDDLTDAEKDLHDLLKSINEYTHNQNFLLGKISKETYHKYKGKYIGREYDFDKLYDQKIGGKTLREILGIYKQRQEVDAEKTLASIKDPIYLTLRRFMQTGQNMAVNEYAHWLYRNYRQGNAFGNAEMISNTERDGFIKLGQGFGALSDKWVARSIAEDFKGFQFNNDLMQLAYDLTKAYDGFPPRQFMKELLTVFNPQVQIGNMTSNAVFSWLGGVDLPTYLSKAKEAYSEIKNRGQVYRDLQNEGMMGVDFVSTDLKPMQPQIGGRPENAFRKVERGVREFYQGVDDAAKIQLYLSLKDMGYSHKEAVQTVFESLQNYQNTGRIWDLASKTPIVGNAFIKFTPEMLRLLKNGMTRRPLHTLALISLLSSMPKVLGKMFGNDDEEIDAAGRQKGIPKIMIPYTDLEIPLSWRLGDKRVNIARYLMPMYMYDVGGESKKATDLVNKFIPYQLKQTEEGGLTPVNVQDPFVAPLWGILTNKDFRDKPIVEETDDATDATIKRLRYGVRGYGGFYANLVDDIFSTSITGEDYYGRRKDDLDVALNVLIKIETFDDERLKQGIIMEFDGYERLAQKIYSGYTKKRKKLDSEIKEIQSDENMSKERKQELIAKKKAKLVDVSENVLEDIADIQEQQLKATEYYRNLSRKQPYKDIASEFRNTERAINKIERRIDGKFKD